LALEEFAELTKDKEENKTEQSFRILYTVWHKADPTVTLDGVRKKVPLRIALKLVKKMTPELFQTDPLEPSQGAPQAEQSTS